MDDYDKEYLDLQEEYKNLECENRKLRRKIETLKGQMEKLKIKRARKAPQTKITPAGREKFAYLLDTLSKDFMVDTVHKKRTRLIGTITVVDEEWLIFEGNTYYPLGKMYGTRFYRDNVYFHCLVWHSGGWSKERYAVELEKLVRRIDNGEAVIRKVQNACDYRMDWKKYFKEKGIKE